MVQTLKIARSLVRHRARAQTAFALVAAAAIGCGGDDAAVQGNTGGSDGGLDASNEAAVSTDGSVTNDGGFSIGDGSNGTIVAEPVTRTDLVTDRADAGDAQTDPNLVNPWGLAFNSAGVAWVSDNGTGVATLYALDGSIQPLVVTVPAPGDGGTSAPTGMVFNPTTGFMGDIFIMSTENGTIAGWQSGTNAVTRVDLSGQGAVFKGIALVTFGGANVLAAADFSNGTVDLFDTQYNRIANSLAFTDSTIPSGFAPFNVVSIGTSVFVSYAKQDDQKKNDVAGNGNGFINVFDSSGRLVKRFASGGTLNSPWGMALAPSNFGTFGGSLLVGNFGNGRIFAYNLATGALRGVLTDQNNSPLAIDGLWSLVFAPTQAGDGGTEAGMTDAGDAGDAADAGDSGGDAGATGPLFFTAGPNEESHGLFGRIDPIR